MATYDDEEEFKRLVLALPPLRTCSNCKRREFRTYFLPVRNDSGGVTLTDELCEECSGMAMIRRSNARMYQRNFHNFPAAAPKLVIMP